MKNSRLYADPRSLREGAENAEKAGKKKKRR
jgi:hypothetical protein